MSRSILLVDLNQDMVTAWKKAFADVPAIRVSNTDIKAWYNHADTFVSASNSKLFFNGGSDLAYQTMFPGVDRAMQTWVKQYGFLDEFGGPFLPVGAATIRTFGQKKLICCPTMLLPQDVSNTENAYHCFKLVLELADKRQDVRTVVVPGLCCGYGRMPFLVSAQQMRRAYDDHAADRRRLDVSPRWLTTLAYNPAIMSLQPKYYQNSQFFQFAAVETVCTGTSQAHQKSAGLVGRAAKPLS